MGSTLKDDTEDLQITSVSFPNGVGSNAAESDSESLYSSKGWVEFSVGLQSQSYHDDDLDFQHSILKTHGKSLVTIPDSREFKVPYDFVAMKMVDDAHEMVIPLDEFESMVNDMRTTFLCWLKRTQIRLKSQKGRLIKEAEELKLEKAAFVQQMKQERLVEAEKLAEERNRQNQEIVSQLKQIQLEREDARRRADEERRKLENDKEFFNKYMQLESEKFRQKVELFEQDQQKIVDSKIATQTMVDINVGGVVFETSRHTLTKQKNSFLTSLLSGRHEVGRDRQGRIFLDRDYELFRIILNFLRNPACLPVPRDLAESSMILNEALYYRINFSPYPLLMCCGGHNGEEHLKSMELLDQESKCWRSCSPMQTERMYFGSGVLNNFVYVFGGYNLDYKALSETEMYDRLRDSWCTVASLKHPRRNNGGASFNDRLFCVGGFDGVNVLDSVESYDVRMRNWIPVAPLRVPRSSAMITHQNGFLYAMGGTSGERLKSIERYDPRMDKWELLSGSLLKVRSAGSICTYNNEIYAVGGIDSVHTVHKSLETWNSKTQSSSFLREAPIGVMDATLTCTSDSLVLVGGQNDEVLDTVFIYKPESDQWMSGPSLTTPRYGHCTIFLDL